MKIFVDAMGGDQAPRIPVAGSSFAVRELLSLIEAEKLNIILLGDERLIKPTLKKYFKNLPKPQVIHCSEVITMGESPVSAARAKKDSSIYRGLELASKTPDSAFFSAGHSGAVFAAALLTMGRLSGVERPAIATAFPSVKGHCILLDAGANVDCRPQHLVDFAYMGLAYARIYRRITHPTVGILSNGEEESKGTELTRTAHELLKNDRNINYAGYVEGKEIFNGKIDVVVTDGFTGNVVLKSLEGLGKTITSIIQMELNRSIWSRLASLLALPALRRVQKKLDYAEVGAAPLLGIDGNCFIGHGRSNAKAIKNGILRSKEAIEMNLHTSLREIFQLQTKAAGEPS